MGISGERGRGAGGTDRCDRVTDRGQSLVRGAVFLRYFSGILAGIPEIPEILNTAFFKTVFLYLVFFRYFSVFFRYLVFKYQIPPLLGGGRYLVFPVFPF